ncbi:Stk1 family PASTA domain-containing Ser/Thr kinase [Calidifontibacillus oryziterrae]|uniref:Stk1 family PASTA domain-containing Ser/Thr kinase n=1 Tax=Calidifontibacillus oryziterrae TaxID=1191699 RepID=UPI000310B35D|nr:Stk1 family PASTA domain-containing Ser/Thr kinase [Calidifontibacillus oryziterrae]
MIIGKRLNGRYKVQEMIGGGGMANVYLAHDMILNRHVAVKVLKPEFSNDDEFIKRFRREAQSATSLDHPNIVSIYDVGEEDHIYFMVMEYVEGTTLKQFIQQRKVLSVKEVVDIMIQITAAIEHAHLNQIVHRDIKPHNILIDFNGNVKVTDFGIAMALSATSITQTNSVLGSVHYLSPEQARGGMANKKSDIYSLGVVMFELLTGRLPFSGESAISIALKHLQSETPSPRRWNPDIPQSVENIVLKATVKDSFRRYDSVTEMRNDLESALHPSRINEPKFEIPEDDEATKAIPIITNEHELKISHDTIVHHTKNGKKKSKKRLIALLLSLAMIFSAGLIAVILFIPSLFEPKDVIIPDVTEYEIAEAIEDLQSVGLKVKPEQIPDDRVQEGLVIKTDPPVNTTVKEGWEVIVYESLGKEKIQFEDFVGQQLEDVIRDLEIKGISADHILPNYIDSDLPENEIIAQLQPLPGDLINPDEIKNMWVIFQVSKGPFVRIPNMKGWSEADVNKFVHDNQLSLDNTSERQYSNELAEGLVVSQEPGENTLLKKGGIIKIVLSRGPEPKTYTFSKIIPFDSEDGESIVEVYKDDMENNIDGTPEIFMISETTEIPIELIIPYNGKATYKIFIDGELLDSEEISYSAID